MHRHEMQQSNIYLGIYIIDYYLFWKIRVLQQPPGFIIAGEENKVLRCQMHSTDYKKPLTRCTPS
jgi:hypothetical protein